MYVTERDSPSNIPFNYTAVLPTRVLAYTYKEVGVYIHGISNIMRVRNCL